MRSQALHHIYLQHTKIWKSMDNILKSLLTKKLNDIIKICNKNIRILSSKLKNVASMASPEVFHCYRSLNNGPCFLFCTYYCLGGFFKNSMCI